VVHTRHPTYVGVCRLEECSPRLAQRRMPHYKAKWARVIAQVGESLPSKHKALSSNHIPPHPKTVYYSFFGI
jgi:hypothetical protein